MDQNNFDNIKNGKHTSQKTLGSQDTQAMDAEKAREVFYTEQTLVVRGGIDCLCLCASSSL